ncbi:FMN-linked oxidoreductase [Auriscalpium vulgare]|uniref:FMN-linked oxidoreductase n=1 Tax=Auriscalpium vulgare TaxID=40419 RepID=A0ACB8R843_9AGAM|nr:FMN-linked oxidoreductase [Auriscalpium vulgare]
MASDPLREHGVPLASAPMVKQSDTPFRALVHAHGATLSYTQMLRPSLLLSDPDYIAFNRRALALGRQTAGPVVVQLCGNDAETLVRGARTVVDLCDGVDLNLGCPQEVARDEHFGAYLLGQKDWPLVQNLVSSLSHALPVPVSAKLRLCTPTVATVPLAQSLAASGAAYVTLHARHASARRRRHGAADLSVVKNLVQKLQVPVVSNGNVRTWEDVKHNMEETCASGVMVGETLLGNPHLFEAKLSDPVAMSLEYLEFCRAYPDTATLQTIQTHVRHIMSFQCQRQPWFRQFDARLGQCASVDEIEVLISDRVRRWRGGVASIMSDEEEAEKTESWTDENFGLNDVFDVPRSP